jgi:hypothetical protein
MKETIPVFILGSGRCGTFQIMKLLEPLRGIEAHHEYLFENVLKTAVLYRMGIVGEDEVLDVLKSTHVPAVYYAEASVWLDSSNALPWIAKPLHRLFPNARFVHLLRDGRKVVSSFYYKFQDVVYGDRSVRAVQEWLANPKAVPPPPPEKKYWRPFPVRGEPYYEAFGRWGRFERLCYYWQDCNRWIDESLKAVPEKQKLVVQLEQLVSDPGTLARFLAMIGIAYDDRHLQTLKRPVNVAIPKNFMLDEAQRRTFDAIAGEAMKRFGYNAAEEYRVDY